MLILGCDVRFVDFAVIYTAMTDPLCPYLSLLWTRRVESAVLPVGVTVPAVCAVTAPALGCQFDKSEMSIEPVLLYRIKAWAAASGASSVTAARKLVRPDTWPESLSIASWVGLFIRILRGSISETKLIKLTVVLCYVQLAHTACHSPHMSSTVHSDRSASKQISGTLPHAWAQKTHLAFVTELACFLDGPAWRFRPGRTDSGFRHDDERASDGGLEEPAID